MERVRRIELPYAAWEAAVLPLNYTRVALDSGHSEPAPDLPLKVVVRFRPAAS